MFKEKIMAAKNWPFRTNRVEVILKAGLQLNKENWKIVSQSLALMQLISIKHLRDSKLACIMFLDLIEKLHLTSANLMHVDPQTMYFYYQDLKLIFTFFC